MMKIKEFLKQEHGMTNGDAIVTLAGTLILGGLAWYLNEKTYKKSIENISLKLENDALRESNKRLLNKVIDQNEEQENNTEE